jgi:hypothetical protein
VNSGPTPTGSSTPAAPAPTPSSSSSSGGSKGGGGGSLGLTTVGLLGLLVARRRMRPAQARYFHCI